MVATRIRHNVIANLAASAYGLLLSIGAIPVYLRLMGIEAMGLVTFHVTLSSVIFIMLAGLSAAVSREVARLDDKTSTRPQIRGLLSTVQPAYWGLGLTVGAVLALGAGPLASSWLHGVQLDPATLRISLLLLALSVGMQLPIGLYLAVLDALQHQALRAAMTSANVTVSVVGAISLLTWGPRSVVTYFAWYVVCAAGFLIALLVALAHRLPATTPQATASSRFYREQGRYILGAMGISVTMILLLQVEKLVLSGAVSLDQLGYYGIASTMALALYRIVQPVNTALMPRINVFTGTGDPSQLLPSYALGLRIGAFLLLPVTALLMVNPDIVLLAWTGSTAVVDHTGPVLRLLALGATVHVLSELATLVQVSGGHVRFLLVFNLASLVVLALGSYWAATQHGIHAAAAVWAAVMAINGLTIRWRMHQQLLATTATPGSDTGRLALMVLIALACQLPAKLLPAGTSPLLELALIAALTSLAYVASALLLPETAQLWARWRGGREPLRAPP